MSEQKLCTCGSVLENGNCQVCGKIPDRCQCSVGTDGKIYRPLHDPKIANILSIMLKKGTPGTQLGLASMGITVDLAKKIVEEALKESQEKQVKLGTS